MKCPPEYAVKQYVAVVRSATGQRFTVLKTGNDCYYWFQTMIGETSQMGDIGFPVLKLRLRNDLKRALANGRGNSL